MYGFSPVCFRFILKNELRIAVYAKIYEREIKADMHVKQKTIVANDLWETVFITQYFFYFYIFAPFFPILVFVAV